MKRKTPLRKFDATSYLMSKGIYWIALAILCPMLIAYFQIYRTGEEAVRVQSDRILNFFIGEVEDVLAETELVLDGYLLKTAGSCAANDLLVLRRHLAANKSVGAMGIIAADGKIACSIGGGNIQNLSFPAHQGVTNTKIEFGELRTEQAALPILIKAAPNGIRIYAIMSQARFKKMLLPGFIADFVQIDVVLPKGGLWYSVTGSEVKKGFLGEPLVLERKSERFPVNFSLVLDRRSISVWSGELRVSIIVIVLLSFAALILSFLAHRFYKAMNVRRMIFSQMAMIEHARLHFNVTYQPLMNMDKNLLVGVLAKADLSLFDKVPQARPTVDEILSIIWDEIGEFALKRREFNIIVQVEGESVIAADQRQAVIDRLKEISYENLTLLMSWENDRGVDSDIYRPLEEVATSGANLAIDCGNVQFSLLSDMWAWPYHQLVVDFSNLPESEEAINWISEIVMNMSEQLQIDKVAIGLENQSISESAIGGGFQVGAGKHYGPDLTIDSLLSAVRPVRGAKRSTSEQKQDEAA
ncbi:MAG: CSS-motif domain-containing protein [Hyphomicrobiales bacterium]